MQILVDDGCCKYQMVKFKDQFYRFRRLDFGLNCAPEIMKAVVSKILSLDESVSKGPDLYYNDIIVDLNEVKVEKVKQHLLKYGLVTKPCKSLGSAKVFGLQRWSSRGHILKSLAEVESSRTSLASRTSSRTDFEVLGLGLEGQVLGLGLEASSPRKLACSRLEDSTIF